MTVPSLEEKQPDEVDEYSDSRYTEYEVFTSIWDALRWKHVRKRIPMCFRRTLHNRYMFANIIYLGYAITLLVVDFHPAFNSSPTEETEVTNETTAVPSPLDEPVYQDEHINRIYIGLAAVNIFVAALYVWAWRGRSWFDVVLIPEYLNHIQAVLYLWSSLWYSKQDTLGGHYTMAVHRIELSASCVELITAVGWMISWYWAYTRVLGRGFTFDDPDTIAYLAITTNTLIYFVYNLQLNIYPEMYGSNFLYTYADIMGFVRSVYYVLGTLRDDNWFWFMPLAGQYSVSVGTIKIETRELPQYGKPPIILTDVCRRRPKIKPAKEITSTDTVLTHF